MSNYTPTALTPNWAGEFSSYQQWVNKGKSWLASPDHRRAVCIDSKGRRVTCGGDFMLARDEGAFPVRFFWDCEPQPLTTHVASAAPSGVWVGTISSGDIEGDEIDWDAEFDRKVVDALPQLRVPNQHYGLFMAPIDGMKCADLSAYAQVEVDDAAIAHQPPKEALTDEQIIKVARYLSDFSSGQCGVDKDDAWKIYGDDEIALVRAALAAAGEVQS